MREIVTAQDGTPVAETERRPYRLSGPRRLAATLGSAAVILLLAGVTWLAVQRSRESTGWVRHTYRVTVVLGRTVSDLVDAETGQRGYLLTGDERYLAPYRQGAARFAHDLEALRGLTRDNPRQQARIGQMQRLGTAKLNELSRTIRLYQQGQADASRAVVRSGQGERLMAQLRAVAAQMQNEEARLLAERQDRERRYRSTVGWVLLASGVLGGALSLLIGTLFSRYAADQEAASAQLGSANTLLRARAGALERRAAEEAALAEVARRLTTAFATDEVLKRIADGALYATEAHGAFVERVDPERTRVTVAAAAGEGLPPLGTAIPYPGSLAADVLERDAPEWIPDVSTERRPIAAALETCCHACAALVVPLVSENDALGALVLLARPGRDPFPPDAVLRARTLADLAAVALRRAILLAEAESASRAKSAFLATVSHEIRTPINAIIGYSELLEMGIDGALNEAQSRRVGRVQASSRHLLGLINDFLDLSRIDAGELGVNLAPVPLVTVARSAVEMMEAEAAARPVRLAYAAECGPDARFQGDEERVRQILLNLLSNAIKFTPPDGWVTVRCRGVRERGPAPGRWTSIEVEDDGIGIAPEQQERIFDPFVQVESGYTRSHEGTGLGLAISRNLARLMGGEVTVRSQPGAGACFTLWLPAFEDDGVAREG